MLAALVLCLVSVSASETDVSFVHLRVHHVRQGPTTTTTTASGSPPYCVSTINFLSSDDKYEDCVSFAFPKDFDQRFLFTPNNTKAICSKRVCKQVLSEAVALVPVDCNIPQRFGNLTVVAADLQQIAAACGVAPQSPTSAPTPAPSKELESDGERTLKFVGIAFGAAVLVILGIIGCAINNGKRSRGGWCFVEF